MSPFADVTEKPINKKTIAEKSNKKLLDLKAHTCFSEKKKNFRYHWQCIIRLQRNNQTPLKNLR